MKKRLLSFACACLLVVGTLAGCGSNGGGQASTPQSGASASTEQTSAGSASDGETYEMRITYAYGDEVPHGRHMLFFKDYLESHSDGRVTVTLFANAQIANSTNEMATVLSGACEAVFTISQVASGVNSTENVWNIPFLMMSELGETKWSTAVNANETIQQIVQKGAEDAGFKRLGDLPTCSGIVLANTVRPLIRPSDAQGLKLRSTSGEAINLFYEAMGASPIAVNANEVAVALQQGVVDGLICSVFALDSSKWPADYCTDGTYCWSCQPFYINLDWWNSLPSDVQEMIEEAFDATHENACKMINDEEPQAQANLTNIQFDAWDMADPETKEFADNIRDEVSQVLVERYGSDLQTIIDEVMKIKTELGYDY